MQKDSLKLGQWSNEFFSKIDYDRSGKISVQEMINIFGSSKLRFDDDLFKHFSAIDTNGDGVIDKSEFKMYLIKALDMLIGQLVKIANDIIME